MAFLLENEEQEIIDIRANGSLSPFYLSYFSGMEPSSPFLQTTQRQYNARWIQNMPLFKVSSKLKIGHHVFIGANTVLARPVTIGNNAVIAVGSVITRDIPNNCLGVGTCKGNQNV